MTTDTLELGGVRHDRPARKPRGFFLSVAYAFARANPAAVADRRELPIRAALGPNGSGKTLCAVRDLLPSLDEGRTVYSTVPLYLDDGSLHPSYRPFTWHALMNARDSDFFGDEISSIAASRAHASLDSEVINRIHQLRKVGGTFSWTAPSWRRADVALREVTWAVTECRGFFPDRAAIKGTETVWAPNRLFRFNTYDMRDFDEWSAGKRESAPAKIREWFKPAGERVLTAYKTLDAVDRLEPWNPNACDHCGLPKRVKTCSGH